MNIVKSMIKAAGLSLEEMHNVAYPYLPEEIVNVMRRHAKLRRAARKSNKEKGTQDPIMPRMLPVANSGAGDEFGYLLGRNGVPGDQLHFYNHEDGSTIPYNAQLPVTLKNAPSKQHWSKHAGK